MQLARQIEIVNVSKNTIVGSDIGVASTAWSRLVGLLGKVGLDLGGGLLIVPSSGVHAACEFSGCGSDWVASGSLPLAGRREAFLSCRLGPYGRVRSK